MAVARAGIATTMAPYTDPFPHSLGQKETNGTAAKVKLLIVSIRFVRGV
jgi:hypothetical protein